MLILTAILTLDVGSMVGLLWPQAARQLSGWAGICGIILAMEAALQGKPPGATIHLSQTPWEAEAAAALGAGSMISGHTHSGQIWPFNYLARLRYLFTEGCNQIR